MSDLPNDDPMRRYREAAELLDEHPSASARAAILAAAARAVESRPHDAAHKPPVDSRRRIRFPLAAAAAVMLSTLAVMLATRTEREQPRFDEPAAPAVAQSPAPAAAPTEVKPADGPARSEEARASAPTVRAKDAVGKQTLARESAPRAEPPRDTRAATAPSIAERGFAGQRPLETDSSVAPPPSAVPAAPASPAPAAKLAAPATATAPAVADSAGESTGALRKDERQRAAQEKAAAAPPASRVAGNAAAEPKKELDAAAWLEKIVALRAKGDDAEADAELKRFRERYPEVVVPPQALARPGTR